MGETEKKRYRFCDSIKLMLIIWPYQTFTLEFPHKRKKPEEISKVLCCIAEVYWRLWIEQQIRWSAQAQYSMYSQIVWRKSSSLQFRQKGQKASWGELHHINAAQCRYSANPLPILYNHNPFPLLLSSMEKALSMRSPNEREKEGERAIIV